MPLWGVISKVFSVSKARPTFPTGPTALGGGGGGGDNRLNTSCGISTGTGYYTINESVTHSRFLN